MMGLYLDEVKEGTVYDLGSYAFTTENIVRFAEKYDPQYFHADPEAARNSVFGEVIASGIYTMALWRKLDHEISGDIAWICGIAWDDVKWPVAVHAGDRLRARFECLAKRPSASDPTRRVVEFRYTLLNQRDEIAWTCRSINLVETGPRVATD